MTTKSFKGITNRELLDTIAVLKEEAELMETVNAATFNSHLPADWQTEDAEAELDAYCGEAHKRGLAVD